MEELNTLFAVEKTVSIFGSDVKIKQISLGDLPKVFELVEPHLKSKELNFKSIAAVLLKNDFDKVTALISDLTDIPKDKVPTMNMAASAEVLANILKENVSFLESHVVPVINKMAASINQSNLAGQPKSKL